MIEVVSANIENSIKNINNVSGLAYLLYWIHKGIEAKDRQAIKTEVLEINFNPMKYRDFMFNWLDEEKTPFWACRYAALIKLELLILLAWI